MIDRIPTPRGPYVRCTCGDAVALDGTELQVREDEMAWRAKHGECESKAPGTARKGRGR